MTILAILAAAWYIGACIDSAAKSAHVTAAARRSAFIGDGQS